MRIVIKLLISLAAFTLTLAAFCQDITKDKPQYGEFQCRTYAQQWTSVSSEKRVDPKLLLSTAVLVNGQIRVIPQLTYGVDLREIERRTSVMSTCALEDVQFQKQFNTYALIERSYREEIAFRYRYFLLNHHLSEAFDKEDADKFK